MKKNVNINAPLVMSKTLKKVCEKLKKRAPKGVDKEKYESCVKQVKAKQDGKVNPWAVCAASLQRSELESFDKLVKNYMNMKKDDKPHKIGSPEERSHAVVEEGYSFKDAIKEMSKKGPQAIRTFLSHLRSIKDKPDKWRSPKNILKNEKKYKKNV